MFKPKHQQLYDLLCEELVNGKWPCDTKLPSLKDIASIYHVSINVASKAVELLKENDLVIAKVGEGIFSQTSGVAALTEFKYSGDRLFGRYKGAKELRILVEDKMDWQLGFWNSFFDEFAQNNPDIELKVSYNPEESQNQEVYDMALGSVEFLSGHGFSPSDLCPVSLLQDYYPDLYDSVLIKPGQMSWKNQCCYFPFGTVYYRVLTDGEALPPTADENVLSYLERISGGRSKPVGYCICSSRAYLHNCGLQFVDTESGEFRKLDKMRTLDVFRRSRHLIRKGHLIWMHGNFSDYGQLGKLTENQPVRMLEYFLNQKLSSESVKTKKNEFSYPFGHHPVLIPEVAGISRRTLFPEECLRILRLLLDHKIQNFMRKCGILASIRSDMVQDTRQAEIFRSYKLDDLSLPETKLIDAIRYFVGWEFFYFVQGKRGEEVVDFIEAKIKHFMNISTG